MKTKLLFATLKNRLKGRVFPFAFSGLIMVLGFAACELEETEYEKQVKFDDEKIQTYLDEQNLNAQKHPDGFYYEELTRNDGGIGLKRYDVVSFYYKISLLDGTLIEEIVKGQDEPAKFKLWSYTIIPVGLDNAIGMMKTGEKYRFYMPSQLAFGSYYSKEFRANSIFIIDVEVVNIETESEIETAQIDSIENYMGDIEQAYTKTTEGLFYIEKSAGEGDKPEYMNRVTIDFTRKYLNDSLIKSITGISLTIGNNEAVKGLEEGLKMMKVGGEATLIMPASLGFKQSLCIVPEKIRAELLADEMISSEVKPYSIVKYDVKLKAIY